jgi:hypothetical protein
VNRFLVFLGVFIAVGERAFSTELGSELDFHRVSVPYVGQSVSIGGIGLQYSDIRFSWFRSADGSAFASGQLFAFSQEYTGSPKELSSSSAGFLGVGTAVNGEYVFDQSLLLNSGVQYFFYQDADIDHDVKLGASVSADEVPGSRYFTLSLDQGFQFSPVVDMAYRLSGTTVPEPSVMSLAVLSAALVIVSNRALRRGCGVLLRECRGVETERSNRS